MRAYNISVKCNTAEERWDWVNKGMKLLRDQGIPNNPGSVTLYKELSWILSHKMGGQTDDMNRYYKMQFCQEWQVLLGAPLTGQAINPNAKPGDPELWLATLRFEQIVKISDDYFRKADAEDGAYGERYYHTALSTEARDRFFKENPETQQIVDELKKITLPNGDNAGLGLNLETLRAFGRIIMYDSAGYNLSDPRVGNAEVLGDDGLALYEWYISRPADAPPLNLTLPITNERLDAIEQRTGKRPINLVPMFDLLRAEALVREYHMDPRFMLKCMEQYGPLDWRHVNTHACYWSSLGTISAQQDLIDLTRIDLINTDRQTIHAVQGLVHGGKLYFRPRVDPLARDTNGLLGSGFIDEAPDTSLIPAYGVALGYTRERIDSGRFGDLSTNTYDQGWENFQQIAVVYYYFGGNLEKAQEVYSRLKEEFGDSDRSAIAKDGEYDLPIADFAIVRLEDDLGYQDEFLIRTLIDWALRRGVANRDTALTTRLLNDAKNKYDAIMEERQQAGAHVGLEETGAQGRRALSPWPIIITQQFGNFLKNSGYDLRDRSVMWQLTQPILLSMSTPNAPLHYQVFLEFADPVFQQLQAQGRDADFPEMFPPPQGLREFLQQQGVPQDNNEPPASIRQQ